MTFDLRCTETQFWTITDGRGTCPDCSALVEENSARDHARWHEQLVCDLLAVCANHDRLSEYALEFSPEDPGECVQLMHQLQIERLHQYDR